MTLPLQILFETAWAASIIPFSFEPTFYALAAFHGASAWPYAIIAVIGALIGQLFNLTGGRALLDFKRRGVFAVSDVTYQRYSYFFNRYMIWLVMLLAWVPLMNLLVLIGGFLNAPIKRCIPLLALGYALKYGYYVFL